MTTNSETYTPSPEPSVTPSAPLFDDRSAFTAAFNKRLAQIQAVPDAELITMNLDFHASVAMVLGALPAIMALRERMRNLPELDQTMIDGLEEYAQAAGEANSRYATSVAPEEDIVALNDEAMKLRETFRSDATALAYRGLIDSESVAQFKGLTGYKNVAFDLIDWANLLRDCWSTIQGKTALTAQEIQHGKDVGERLVRASGLRDQGPALETEVARTRRQALTLLANAYSQARRAVTFLRWNQGDIETIAPSLYGGRVRGKAATPDAPVAAPPAPNPETAPAAPAAPQAPQHVATAPVGMPGASPFAN